MRLCEKLKDSFTFQDALAIVLKASGLRHDDYDRYREFCTRQIRLIRKGRKPLDKGGRRSRKPTAGKSVSPAKLTPMERDMLLLLKCERAFAHAMVYRRDSTGEPRKVYHARKRWKRAEDIANKLANRRKKRRQDFGSFLHYYLMMKANRLFEYRKWSMASKVFDRNFFKSEQKSIEAMKMRAQLMDSLQRYCVHMKARGGDSGMDIEGEEGDNDLDLMEGELDHGQALEAADQHDWFGFRETNKLTPREIVDALTSKDKRTVRSGFWKLASNRMRSYCILIWSYARWKSLLDRLEDVKIVDLAVGPRNGHINLIRALGARARLMCKSIDRCLSWNANLDFTRDMKAMRDCLSHFSSLFMASSKILRGKLTELPTNLPPPRDFRVIFLHEGPSMEMSDRFYNTWKGPLGRVATAFGRLPADYEMTACGPQPIKQHASFLETLGEFRLFKEPRQAIFTETNFAEIIPMKPIFYDLAYDMLDTPTAQ